MEMFNFAEEKSCIFARMKRKKKKLKFAYFVCTSTIYNIISMKTFASTRMQQGRIKTKKKTVNLPAMKMRNGGNVF